MARAGDYLKKIEKEIKKEKQELHYIEKKVGEIEKEIVEKEPPHFSKKDIITAFFGALIIGLTFVFKGSLVQQVLNLTLIHLSLVVTSTLVILSIQIYFIGYKKVKDKKHRDFPQFLMKRLTTLYIIALIVSLYLVYIFNIDHVVGGFLNAFKLVVVLSMPCSIGAAIPSLIKQD